MTTPYVDLNTVFTPSSGGVPTVAYLSDIRSNLETLAKAPGCKVQRTTAQALTTSTFAAIQFNAADLRDTDAFHDTTTNNSRMTVPTGLSGWYAISGQVQYVGNGTGLRQVYIQVNGVTSYANVTQPANATINTLDVYDEIFLNAGDYAEIWAWQNSGGNLNVSLSTATMRFVAVS